jgi:hypothetical protein
MPSEIHCSALSVLSRCGLPHADGEPHASRIQLTSPSSVQYDGIWLPARCARSPLKHTAATNAKLNVHDGEERPTLMLRADFELRIAHLDFSADPPA